MKKAMRKIIPALVMLLIAAAFVGTSTYAWFSMNRTVTVAGMSVTTVVTDNLLISDTYTEASYGTTLEQTVTGKLRPVSTINGVDFYYTGSNNVSASGSAKTASYNAYSEEPNPSADPTNALTNSSAGKTHYDAGFNTAYGVGSPILDTVLYGYVDYVFYIRANNVSGVSENLTLTELNLTYNSAAISANQRAWRVAVFSQAATEYTAVSTSIADTDCKAIIAPASAAYYTSGKAAASASTLDTVTPLASANWHLGSVAAGAVNYFKVTVRLWIEGEDNTCTNATFANLTSAYSLDLAFELAAANAGLAVTSIPVTSVAP